MPTLRCQLNLAYTYMQMWVYPRCMRLCENKLRGIFVCRNNFFKWLRRVNLHLWRSEQPNATLSPQKEKLGIGPSEIYRPVPQFLPAELAFLNQTQQSEFGETTSNRTQASQEICSLCILMAVYYVEFFVEQDTVQLTDRGFSCPRFTHQQHWFLWN
jgi:hypothetical protein